MDYIYLKFIQILTGIVIFCIGVYCTIKGNIRYFLLYMLLYDIGMGLVMFAAFDILRIHDYGQSY